MLIVWSWQGLNRLGNDKKRRNQSKTHAVTGSGGWYKLKFLNITHVTWMLSVMILAAGWSLVTTLSLEAKCLWFPLVQWLPARPGRKKLVSVHSGRRWSVRPCWNFSLGPFHSSWKVIQIPLGIKCCQKSASIFDGSHPWFLDRITLIIVPLLLAHSAVSAARPRFSLGGCTQSSHWSPGPFEALWLVTRFLSSAAIGAGPMFILVSTSTKLAFPNSN